MSNKFRRITVKARPRISAPGSSPGTLALREDALKPQITVYAYTAESLEEVKVGSYSELQASFVRFADRTVWADVRGLGDLNLFTSLQEDFQIGSLVLEDILNTHQRPKLEEYPNYCFAISRMLCLNKDLNLENEQVSFLLTEKILFTFQENYDDCLEPVRKRLREGKGSIRTGGTSYMMYSLMDVILDNYFSLVSRLGEDLEMLEERLYRRPDKSITYETHQLKRALATVRRAVWPERDKLNDMLRSTSDLISDETKLFLRDAYDHAIQLIDLVENYKDISSSLVEMYLSFTSNRMNEIVKLLTVVSSIFIPLTFIAGVYGMNFAREDPETGKILYNNMPELYEENGYIYTILAMLAIGIIQLLWFWKKGWLK